MHGTLRHFLFFPLGASLAGADRWLRPDRVCDAFPRRLSCHDRLLGPRWPAVAACFAPAATVPGGGLGRLHDPQAGHFSRGKKLFGNLAEVARLGAQLGGLIVARSIPQNLACAAAAGGPMLIRLRRGVRSEAVGPGVRR